MTVKVIVKKNTYHDSVSLMVLSAKANTLAGVRQASVVAMGTDLNKEVIRNIGLMTANRERRDGRSPDRRRNR